MIFDLRRISFGWCTELALELTLRADNLGAVEDLPDLPGFETGCVWFEPAWDPGCPE